MLKNNFFTGANYLLSGFRMLGHPSLRIFIWLPVTLNIIVFLSLSIFLFQQFSQWLDFLTDWLPEWLEFLAWIVGFLSAIAILILYGYSFSILTNLIGAPFYGVLAERIEQLKTGQAPDAETLWQLVSRTIGRELSKIIYFITRGIGVILLCFIPPIGQIISLPWSSWSMSVQYCDYAADNQQISFLELRTKLRSHLLCTHGFGGFVMLGMMIPILNIILAPAAVIGGTLYWLDLPKKQPR